MSVTTRRVYTAQNDHVQIDHFNAEGAVMKENLLTIGLAQRAPLPIGGTLDAFREDVAATLKAHPGIDMLVYPEMHLHSAEHLPETERKAALEAAAVPLTDRFVTELGSVAAQHGIWLVPGSIGERANDGYFNTELLFGPDGKLCVRYRKMFPWRPYEPHKPGTEFVVADVNRRPTTVSLGLSNCYDSWFPEHTRQLAWLGAQAVINVVKTTTSDREQELVLARANAIVNQLYFYSVNCAAPVGRGRSIAIDPEGYVLAEAGCGEQTLVVPFNPGRLAMVRRVGTCGLTRPWDQFDPADTPINLPMYDGRIDPNRWSPQAFKQRVLPDPPYFRRTNASDSPLQ